VDEAPSGEDLDRLRSELESDRAAVRGDLSETPPHGAPDRSEVDWLMANALITADAPICDLDGDVDEAMVKLAAKVERGERFHRMRAARQRRPQGTQGGR